ncbi:MAG TPA: hypothetical protein VKZ55_13420 [Microthrixaceae bacterium]|nr:hypothetical protein [Microthrixaceae bacterium]
MPLSERSRSAIFRKLSVVVDEESIEELRSHFPARDVEEPVTEDHVRAEFVVGTVLGAAIPMTGILLGAILATA